MNYVYITLTNNIYNIMNDTTQITVFNDSITINPTTCPICFDTFGGENIPLLLNKCNHQYCKKCIKKWYTVQKTCPICRRDVDAISIFSNIEHPIINSSYNSIIILFSALFILSLLINNIALQIYSYNVYNSISANNYTHCNITSETDFIKLIDTRNELDTLLLISRITAVLSDLTILIHIVNLNINFNVKGPILAIYIIIVLIGLGIITQFDMVLDNITVCDINKDEYKISGIFYYVTNIVSVILCGLLIPRYN